MSNDKITDKNYPPDPGCPCGYSPRGLSPLSEIAKGRALEWGICYPSNNWTDQDIKVSSNGNIEKTDMRSLSITFNKEDKNYWLRINLPNHEPVDGVSVRMRLKGWTEAHKWSVAWMDGSSQYKIGNRHWLDGEWQTICVGSGDIIYKLDNPKTNALKKEISDIRVLIGGDFKPGASLEVEWISLWREVEMNEKICRQVIKPTTPLTQAKNLSSYLQLRHPDWRERWSLFKNSGHAPLVKTSLPWDPSSSLPDKINEIGTYAWSWSNLHSVQICCIAALEGKDPGALCAARDFAARWLDQFFTLGICEKREWHEHGAAERLLSLVFIYLLGLLYSFDSRFLNRARAAISMHGRLLENEAFYTRHQKARFHNHGSFQDFALLYAGIALEGYAESRFWLETARKRSRQMFDGLYAEDGEFLVSVENSFGYHSAGAPNVRKSLAALGSTEEDEYYLKKIPKMDAWTRLINYSDSQFPATGDTFRKGRGIHYRHKSLPEKGFHLLAKAGYCAITGHHEETFYKFLLVGSSLSETHKHCDNLSFTLYFDGIEWLIDPSFYNHEYCEWPASYFRSAAAHNNLYIKDLDYSIEPGKCRLSGDVKSGNYKIRGSHNCYNGFEFRRNVTGSLNRFAMYFVDQVLPTPINLRMRLHCGENVEAKPMPGGAVLLHPESEYELHVKCARPLTILRNQKDGGIAGTEFCKKTEINTLEFDCANIIRLSWQLYALKRCD